jgi:hypothetical protein
MRCCRQLGHTPGLCNLDVADDIRAVVPAMSLTPSPWVPTMNCPVGVVPVVFGPKFKMPA